MSGDRGADSIPDLFPNMGPLSGIYSCLQGIRPLPEFLLFLPVDMPQIKKKFLKQLMDETILCAEKMEAIHFENYALPFLLRCSAESILLLSKMFESHLTQSERSIHDYLSQLNVKKINLTEEDLFWFSNVNTVEDYKQLNSGGFL